MDEELDNIEQAREREHYSLDPRDQPFADDVDPDDESWRDEPEPEQDEEPHAHAWSSWDSRNLGRLLATGYERRYCECGAEQTRRREPVTIDGRTADEWREAAAALRRTDARMRELTAMPPDVQKAVLDGAWEEA